MDKEHSSEKKKVSLFPSLDSVDYFSIALWLGLLIPAIQLPFDATYSFPRTVFFVLWLVAFSLYVVIRMVKEKRLLFYSSSVSNIAFFALLVIVLLSYALSASPIDSLFGYNVTFFTSSLILFLSLLAVYTGLRIAGLSLEVQVSRFLSTLPFALATADIISVLAFLIPYSVYQAVLGGMAQYYAFLTLSPFALLGNLAQSSLVHVLALIVVIYQISQVPHSKKRNVEIIRKAMFAFVLGVSGSYLMYFTYPSQASGGLFSSLVVAYALLVAGISVIAFTLKSSEQVSKFFKAFGLVIAAVVLLGVLWTRLGFVSKNTAMMLSRSETNEIVKDSYFNEDKQSWRLLSGYGAGTFPYLYFEQRSIDAARNLGSEVYLYYPSTLLSEIFVEMGILGLLAFALVAFAAIKTYLSASNKSVVTLEGMLLYAIVIISLFSPSFLALYVILFVALASYFDKVESLPEALPRIRALEVKETLYTNRSITRSSQLLLVIVVFGSVMLLATVTKPTVSMVGYTRAISRYYIANTQVQNKDDKALETYENAFSLAARHQGYCKDCTQLSSLQAAILMRLRSMYSGLTEEQRSQSSDYQNVRFLLAQIAPELTIKNPRQYDYWLTSAQIYKAFAFEENSDTLKALALTSTNNALTLNPYSVPAHYLYIDLLISLGNNETINARISQVLAELKQLVNSPPQVRIIDAILLARTKDYDGALSALEKIKQEVQSDGRYSETDKNAIVKVVDSTIDEIKKAKDGSSNTGADKPNNLGQSTDAPRPTPTPTVTPSATPTPTS